MATKEEKIKMIEEFCDSTFLVGKNNQIKNCRSLAKFLQSNRIALTIDDTSELVKNSLSLKEMLDGIINIEGVIDLVNNNTIEAMLISYSMLTGKEIKEAKEVVEEETHEESEERELDLSYDTLAYVDSVHMYLRELDSELLSQEEEKELGKRIMAGDEEAKKELAEHNLRLVVSVVKHYRNSNISMLDLIQEGNLGLLKAVEKFDYTKGFRFSTYATWWIRQAVTRYIADKSRTIRVPVHLHEVVQKVKKTMNRYEQEHGEVPSNEMIADILGISIEKVEQAQRIATNTTVSLSTPVKGTGADTDETELAEMIEDPTTKDSDYSDNIFLEEFRHAIFETDILTDREKFVLSLRNGFKDGKLYTLEEVGNKLGVTRERVRQIEGKALRKLKHNRQIKSFNIYGDNSEPYKLTKTNRWN